MHEGRLPKYPPSILPFLSAVCVSPAPPGRRRRAAKTPFLTHEATIGFENPKQGPAQGSELMNPSATLPRKSRSADSTLPAYLSCALLCHSDSDHGALSPNHGLPGLPAAPSPGEGKTGAGRHGLSPSSRPCPAPTIPQQGHPARPRGCA